MKHSLPDIPEDQKTPLVQILLRIIQDQAEEIALLKDEIAKLRGQKPRPKIPPSRVSDDAKHKRKAAGSDDRSSVNRFQRQKRKEERVIQPGFLPNGARFRGYEQYTVQDLQIEAVEIQFKLAVYTAPDGSRIRGELPPEYRQGHFGVELQAYCIAQYFHCHVTEPLLLEQLHDMGIDISAAQLSNLLILNREQFHQEKSDVHDTGIRCSDFLNVDDTGARHGGKNGYCTSISSPLFTSFGSTDSKSRINFLKLLQGSCQIYAITPECLDYAFEKGVSDDVQEMLEQYEGKQFTSLTDWERFQKKRGIHKEQDLRISTEAALAGGLFALGIDLTRLPIISDAAQQFTLCLNGLCWVHEERHYRKLIPVSDSEGQELEQIRAVIWGFYEELKRYKLCPTVAKRAELSCQFDQIFDESRYRSAGIRELVVHTKARRKGLLLVLQHPNIPLHNNDSERDIREYAKRRKISGSTRSAAGQKARDTFTSLKKTCRKLRVSFWGYVRGRLVGETGVPPLSELILQKAQTVS